MIWTCSSNLDLPRRSFLRARAFYTSDNEAARARSAATFASTAHGVFFLLRWAPAAALAADWMALRSPKPRARVTAVGNHPFWAVWFSAGAGDGASGAHDAVYAGLPREVHVPFAGRQGQYLLLEAAAELAVGRPRVAFQDLRGPAAVLAAPGPVRRLDGWVEGLLPPLLEGLV